MAQELLKEAIADAKAVREVALQNAKMALEEAFDSKIKNMLSAKLAEELEEDVELEELYEDEDEENVGEAYDNDEDDAMEEDFDLDEEINLDELMAELEISEADEDEDEGMSENEIKEVFDPVMADLAEYFGTNADTIAKFVAGLSFTVLPTILAAATMGKEALKKALEKAGLKKGAKTADAGKEKETQSESFDIDALIAEIEAELEEGKKETKDNEELEEARRRAEKAEKDLNEALSTVSSLRESISEMNLLNSKLLYCNKLFRANSLNESQKIKVVDALDKANTAGEAKLVYETLQESFAFTGVEKRAIKEGLARASKPAGVAPKKVITESVDETVSRFQKLANIQL